MPASSINRITRFLEQIPINASTATLVLGLFLIAAQPSQAQFNAGTGTAEDPYIITNVQELNLMRFEVNAHYKLGNDIDASETASWDNGAGYLPFGGGRSPFTGSLDGNGFTIEALTINRPDLTNVGVIGEMGEGGIIKNIRFTNASINGDINTGIVVGRMFSATVENVNASGTVHGADKTGGLVGELFHNGIIRYNRFTGSVNGSNDVGGLIGTAIGANIQIYGNLAVAEVAGLSRIGGLIGKLEFPKDIPFHENAAISEVTGPQDTGGLIGLLYQPDATTIRNVYARGSVSGTTNTGGLIGRIATVVGNLVTIQNSYAAATVSGSTLTGAIIGSGTTNISMQYVYRDTDVTSNVASAGSGATSGIFNRNTSEMHTQMTYWSWDFTDVWAMADGVAYPYLRSHIDLSVDLDAPTDLIATGDEGVVYLSWTPSSEATRYTIHRAAVPGDFTVARIVGYTTGRLFNDFSGTPGVEYNYWVVAHDDYDRESAELGPESAASGSDIEIPQTGTATLRHTDYSWEYFDFSLGLASDVAQDGDFFADIRGTSNEGVNFGNEMAPEIDGRRVLFLGYGSLADVRHVPVTRIDAAPWLNVSWELDGMPIIEGQIWAVFTSENDYAVMQITDVPDDHGDEFSFSYMYQPGGSQVFRSMDGVPHTLVLKDGDFQVAQPGTLAAEPLRVRVQDEMGNGIAGVIVRFELTDRPSNEWVWMLGPQRAYVLTDSEGYAATTLKVGMAEGNYYTSATTQLTGETVVFTTIAGDLPSGVTVGRMLGAGWNLVGLPVDTESRLYTDVFPSAVPNTLFGFDGSYIERTELVEGEGYWINIQQEGEVLMSGEAISEVAVALREGWNLIAGPTEAVALSGADDPLDLIIPGTLFRYVGSYLASDSLHPGFGYWVLSSGDGDITLGGHAEASDKLARAGSDIASVLGLFAELRFQSGADYAGGTADAGFGAGAGAHAGKDALRVYFDGSLPAEMSPLSFLMPPLAPGLGLDVRTEDGFRLSESSAVRLNIRQGVHPVVLAIRSADGGLSEADSDGRGLGTEIRTNLRRVAMFRVEQWDGDMLLAEVMLRAGDPLLLKERTGSLVVSSLGESDELLPAEFALEQNFPNPFNPSTTIRYALPEAGQVRLEVFTVTGQRVAVLAEGERSAGWHTVTFDGLALASGVYIYRLQAGGFVQTRKLMLVK
jgi:hypothetical protein